MMGGRTIEGIGGGIERGKAVGGGLAVVLVIVMATDKSNYPMPYCNLSFIYPLSNLLSRAIPIDC